jgi:hypothetical protein
MTSFLTKHNETEVFKGANGFNARNMRELRHALLRQKWLLRVVQK